MPAASSGPLGHPAEPDSTDRDPGRGCEEHVLALQGQLLMPRGSCNHYTVSMLQICSGIRIMGNFKHICCLQV